MAHELPPCHGKEHVTRLFSGTTMIPRASAASTQGAKNNANPGLVFDRYLRIWYQTRSGLALSADASRQDGEGKSDPGRRADLEDFCSDYEATHREGLGLVATTHRRLKSLLKRHDETVGYERTYFSRSRVVTGLGGDHPLENGFVFDRSSGAPYFPGTTVKGLCRAALKAGLVRDAEQDDTLFGVDPESSNGAPHSSGRLVFLPAYAAKDHWPKLEVDVVNNHYPSYYRALAADRSQREARGPNETDSPIPVFFLTVAAKTPFTFRIYDRRTPADLALVERAFACLEAGLDYLGIGAKTAVGYGTFRIERSSS